MLIDSHAHIDGAGFAQDRSAVLQRCLDSGVEQVVNIVSPFENEGLPELQAVARDLEFPLSFASGVHPHDASRYDDGVEQSLQRFVEQQGVAWGEIGLDYHYLYSPKEDQRQAFARQIRMARRLGLPIVVHSREADEETLSIMRDESAHEVGGVIHCFTGGDELADGALEMGFHISFSGIVTFKNAGRLREIAVRIPDDRIMVETDSPYLTPVPFRGKRNEPAHVRLVAEALARERGSDFDEFAQQTRTNTQRLFQGAA